MSFPTPKQLAGLEKFDSWYPNQAEAFTEIMSWLGGPERFLCMSAPTGSGKSILSILPHLVSRKRTAILTSTKALQEQMLRDFEEHGLVDIRGQNSYVCRANTELQVDSGPCHVGFQCQYRKFGCYYYDQLAEAKYSGSIVTNYAYWMSQHEYGDGISSKIGEGTLINPFQLLVCDEAHLAFKAIESHIATSYSNFELDLINFELPDDLPEILEEWKEWAKEARRLTHNLILELEEKIDLIKEAGTRPSQGLLRKVKTARNLENKILRLVNAKGDWAWEQSSNEKFITFTPVWPSEYANYLFLDVPKVLVMSATLTEKTVDLLGIPKEDRRMYEVPSSFPPENTPIVHIPTAHMRYNSEKENLPIWVNRIDQIIDKRQDRKGLIFTVSYGRRNELLDRSRHSDIMITHATKDVYDQVQKFRELSAPRVLVSPSVTTGWDLPECDYIIIGKIPYPDSRNAVMVARREQDKDYPSFLAMELLVQVSGRGSRSVEDTCEVFIIDDAWRNYYWKNNKHFAPQWFHDRVQGSVDFVPEVKF